MLLLLIILRSQSKLCLKADIIGEMSVETFKAVSIDYKYWLIKERSVFEKLTGK